MHNGEITFIEVVKAICPLAHTVALSVWGGIVHHIQVLQAAHRAFSWKAFLSDISASAFAGWMAYYATKSNGIEGEKASLIIGISGYVGIKALRGFRGRNV